MRKQLAKNIRDLVYAQDITVTALAEEFGVSRIAFYTWMKHGNMSVRRVEQLAKFFGVDEMELLK